MNIQELRQKYPQYSDMNDEDLANSFYQKYYSDMPKEQFMESFIGKRTESSLADKAKGVGKWMAEGAYEAIPAATALAGGVVGAASPVPGGTALGGVGGYYAGKQLQSLIHGDIRTPRQQVGDLAEGAAAEVGGKVISKAAEGIGTVAKQLIGKTTGAGKGSVEYALQGGKEFTDAMRGTTTKEDIVQNFREGLASLREQRAAVYRPQLEAIAQNSSPINISPIKQKLENLKRLYGIKTELVTNEAGELVPKIDYSRTAIGNKGTNDVRKIVDIVKNWGTKEGDTTAIGLDTLKRQLDDFYSESSKARAFVASLRSEVKKTIEQAVPEYAAMTKGYSDSTKMINQIEKSLMLGKDKTADQVLRRIMSAGRENFEFRREMVELLGNKSGQNLMAQISGYNMSPALPRGLIGPLAAGGMGTLAMFNPQYAPMLATASPRVMGEFLNFWGKALKETQAIRPAVTRGLSAFTVDELTP